ncbi:MAG TPA: efflux RND transporter periplasmic adaptor subunit [Candidatus Acidoferrales bacterium]|nr:efflux RND transporter periplasmic adaptor subunit [Candidatus Acidoferrales bacterium]
MLAVAFLGLFAVAGCTDKAAAPPDAPVIPVMAAKVVQKPMPIELHAIGTGEAHATVSVESQVAGIVKAVYYEQGQYVKKGDLLVSLDDRPFQATLQLTEANSTKDKAQAELARVQAERYDKLYQSGIVPKEQYDQFVATADAAEASVKADQAQIETAKLQVSYCSIYAPISGRVGSQLIYPGAVVKANDVPVLVVINEISPIYVDFSVPQQYLDEIKRYMSKGRLAVQVVPSDNSAPESGYLTFVDNAVDPSTGTIKLKGTFANADLRLWPGEFVNVVLRLAEQGNAIVVPSQAVQTGQQGDYVFVIKPDMTVDSRLVEISRTINGESVVTEGLTPGETVVTDGQVRLVPGSKVEIKTGL